MAVVKHCEQCHEGFTSKRRGRMGQAQRFCSTECWYDYLRENPTIHPRFKGGKFPYYGPNWLSQSRKARKRDNYACQDCGFESRKPALPVHHIKPRRLFADDHLSANDLSNLVTLCPSCHMLREHHDKQYSMEDFRQVPAMWHYLPVRRRAIEDRFWEKVDKSKECWIWTANISKRGWAQFGLEAGVQVYAHKFAYEMLVGAVPDGKTLYQRCENNSCVNPAHMDVVDRHPYFVRTHCAKGHPFNEENTYTKPNGKRRCRICAAEGERQRKTKALAA